ncbi:MAG: hypothetical protein ABL867_02310 [Rickettsiales bacterium]
MKLFRRFLRKFYTKHYIHSEIKRTQAEYNKKRVTKGLSKDDRHYLEHNFSDDMRELDEWLEGIENQEMLKKAKKMDIELSDFPYPHFDEDDSYQIKNSHYYIGHFGERLLRFETRQLLRKAISEKAPAYKKEKRENIELFIKGILMLSAFMGTATGLISAIKH